MKRLKQKNYLIYMLPAIILISVFVYIPIIQNFYYSLFRMNSYTDEMVFVGLSNYKKIFADEIFYISLKNNIYYAVISIVCQVGFGTVLAILLESKLAGKLRVFFRNIYFLPSVISVTAVGLLWYFIYNPNMGMLNSLLIKMGLENFTHAWLGEPNIAIFAIIAMSQWQYVGYIMILIIVAIQKIPIELYESAQIDGANGLQKALKITIPNIKETLLVTSVITVIGSFKLFTEVYVMTSGGPYNSTQVLGTYLYNTAFMYDEMGYAAAIAVIIFVITFSVSILQIKISNSGKE